MSKKRKLLEKVLNNSRNITFDEIVILIKAFGFRLARINGSHHIFSHPDIPELVNIQNYKGKAKSYQVKQFLSIVEEYNLNIEDGSEQE